MPIETIRLQITGPNAQTKTAQVAVDANGNGSASFVLSGALAGVDSVQAFIDTHSAASNIIDAIWQDVNGPIAVGPVAVFFRGGDGSGNFPAAPAANSFSTGPVVNSLMFNTWPESIIPGDPTTSANQSQPIINNALSNSGTWAGDVPISGASGNIDMVFTGVFVVRDAGTLPFMGLVNAAFVLAVPGATVASGPTYFGGTNTTPLRGYTAQIGYNGPSRPWNGGEYQTINFSLNFPAPGIYPFEICFTGGQYHEKQFDLLVNGGAMIPPVSMVTAPPSPAAGTGVLQLTPPTVGPAVINGTQTINLAVAGLTYKTKPYIGLLEGVAGDVFLFNDPTANTFTLPTINGTAVDPAAAAASIFTLTGDNGSWKGRLAVQYASSAFSLHYNGNSFDPNVAATQLTLTEEDVAWYNGTNKTFDLFVPNSAGGGVSAEIEIDYFIMPIVASIVPGAVAADGANHVFALTFTKPIPPFQVAQGINFNLTGNSGLTVVSTVPVLDVNGWMTGATITATAQESVGSLSASFTLTLTGQLTYLNGSAFTTGTVTYINAQNFAVTLNGLGASATSSPVIYAWSVQSDGNPAASYGLGASTVLTATVRSLLNNFSTGSFSRIIPSGSAYVVSTVAASNVRQVNGFWLADFVTTINTSTPTYTVYPYYQFSFAETNADGGVVNYSDTTQYATNNYTPPTVGSKGSGWTQLTVV